ncbi:Uncharacterised protein [Mycobacteroides abscessus subsp. abscessus]|nr:Uncharacterised protein [Mycobacteroides abscessus subsp. abscessus]
MHEDISDIARQAVVLDNRGDELVEDWVQPIIEFVDITGEDRQDIDPEVDHPGEIAGQAFSELQ